ncbi:hypothetical protein KFL_009100010, partial [Klebsormidium nitens]
MYTYPYGAPAYAVMTTALPPQPTQLPAQPPAAPPPTAPPYLYAQPTAAPTPAAQTAFLPPPPAPAPPQPATYAVTSYAAPQVQPYPQSTPPPQNAPAPQQYAPTAPQAYQPNGPPPHQYPPPGQTHSAPPQTFQNPPQPNPPNGGYGRPNSQWDTEPPRWNPNPNWQTGNVTGPPSGTNGPPNWNRNTTPPPNARVELYPARGPANNDFPPLQPRQAYPQQFAPPQRNTGPQWNGDRQPVNETARPKPEAPSGGPIRHAPRQQNPRSSGTRPPVTTPYEKPAAKATVLRQSVMPYFTTVQGEFTQLCVNTAQDKPCTEPKCKFSHAPKHERPCPAFHTPKEKCSFDSRCLLGHAKAREAVRQSKAFARHKEWQSQVKTTPGTYGDNEVAESGTGKETLPKPRNELALEPAPNPQNNTGNPAVPAATENTPPTAPQGPNPPEGIPPPANSNLDNNPAVNFQTLAQQSTKRGQEDELLRLSLLTQALQADVTNLQKAQDSKNDEMRTLQTAMGSIQAENTTLRQENERLSALIAKTAKADGVATRRNKKSPQDTSAGGNSAALAGASGANSAAHAPGNAAAASPPHDVSTPGVRKRLTKCFSSPPGEFMLRGTGAMQILEEEVMEAPFKEAAAVISIGTVDLFPGTWASCCAT